MAEANDPPVQVKISVFTPIIYLSIMILVFSLFVRFLRKRRLNQLTNVEPIFEENYPLTLFTFLKERYNDASQEGPDVKVLQAALLRRAAEAIRRALKLEENKTVYNRLYQEGLIGETVFKQFEFQLKFQELEIKDIVAEAEALHAGWSQTFFRVAQEICFNEALRRRLQSLQTRGKELSELWDLPHTDLEKKPVDIEDVYVPTKEDQEILDKEKQAQKDEMLANAQKLKTDIAELAKNMKAQAAAKEAEREAESAAEGLAQDEIVNEESPAQDVVNEESPAQDVVDTEETIETDDSGLDTKKSKKKKSKGKKK